VSAANTRLRDGLHDTYLRKISLPHRFLVSVIFIIMIAGFIFQTGVTIGKYYFSSIRDVKLNEDISRNDLISLRDKAYRASYFDPLESQYQYAVANIEKLLSQNEVAMNAYRRAVQLNPVNGEYLQRFGLILSEFKYYDKAEKFLLAGIEYNPDNPMRYKRYALWLFALGRKDDGIKVMQDAISLEPRKTREYITIMVLNRLSDEDILRALPERVEPHLLFADYLYSTGKDRMAEGEYLNALKFIKNENKIAPVYFYSVYNYYIKKGRYADALGIMRQAAVSIPDDAGIRITTGDIYEKLNLTHKAAEEYKQALVIDPKNGEARKRLSNILSKSKNQ
jgi:tetratricopeptide (TPR) repeat protein